MFLQCRLPQFSSKPELGLNTSILREELSHELFLIILLFSWCVITRAVLWSPKAARRFKIDMYTDLPDGSIIQKGSV